MTARADPLSPPLVLGIETSCDDTACALVDGRGRILSSVVSSQSAHVPYGGVVPEMASREHLRNWPWVSGAALGRAEVDMRQVDVVAATRGPGLIGSLLVGLSLGKSLAYALGRPFHAVHHLEGHLYSPFLLPDGGPAEVPPAEFVGVVVSGGHTALYQVRGTSLETVAQTRDDAMGEAFDKVGRRLGLPFPGGPHVDALAELGRADRHPMTLARCGTSLDFSYSGLKSQALGELQRLQERGVPVAVERDREPTLPQPVLDLLAGFRAAAVAQILERLDRLRGRRALPLLAVSGGAAANRLLRRELVSWCKTYDVPLRLVPLVYSGDNAAMIAHAALLRHRRGEPASPFTIEAQSRLPLIGT